MYFHYQSFVGYEKFENDMAEEYELVSENKLSLEGRTDKEESSGTISAAVVVNTKESKDVVYGD